MDTEIKQKITAKNKWIRLLFMILFFIIRCVVWWIVVLIVIFQFFWNLFVDLPNDRLLSFSKHLNTYYYQILNFLTYNTEVKPFPIGEWPSDKG